MSPQLRAAGRRRYVSLTTFRRDGTGVSTPVWIAPDDDALVVMTGARTFKVKRLRRDDRVELRECSASGRVQVGAPVTPGRAEVVDEGARVQRAIGRLAVKYGWQLRVVLLIERVLAAEDEPDRVVLRIRDA